MNRRYAILSALLRYPDASLRADLADIQATIPQAEFSRQATARLLRLARRLGVGEALDREEAYVRLFDRGRGTSLHLFEHVHGDTRNRGPAMLELAAIYESAGYAMDAHELPDFLPMMLEFCAVAPAEVAANLLGQAPPSWTPSTPSCWGAAPPMPAPMRPSSPRCGPKSAPHPRPPPRSRRRCPTPRKWQRSTPPGRPSRSSSGRNPTPTRKAPAPRSPP